MGNIEIKKETTVNICRGVVFLTTVPKIIAELVGLKKGQKILWRYDGNKLIVEPLKEEKNN